MLNISNKCIIYILVSLLIIVTIHITFLKNSNIPYNDFIQRSDTHLRLIKIDQITNFTSSSAQLVVAIIDTGVDFEHPYLKDSIVKGINLYDFESIPYDDNGHGTNVAGLVVGIGNYANSKLGLPYNVKIMPIKALKSNASSNINKLVEAIKYAVDNGAHIISLSLGINHDRVEVEDIIGYAEEKHVLIIAATGNDGGAVKFPAAYPTVLAVGGISSHKKMIGKSNIGPEVDIVAPLTAYTTFRGGIFSNATGTSISVAQVAGAAALVMSKYPDLKPYQIRELLRKSTEDLETQGWDPLTGYGMLRVDKALIY